MIASYEKRQILLPPTAADGAAMGRDYLHQERNRVPYLERVKIVGMLALGGAALLLASLLACSPYQPDVEFARTFIMRLKAADPMVASDMAPALLAMASAQTIETSIGSRLPTAAIDSIVFVSRKIDSSMPATVRAITLNVFGGTEYSAAKVFLETEKNGTTMVNTISVQGPVRLP
jgi:hypothetical protein